MTEQPLSATLDHQVPPDRPVSVTSETRERADRTRILCTTLFAAALLSFLLPFGTVSCSEPPITFTGVELATSTVHGDDQGIVDEIEDQGTLLALIAGVSVLIGAGLAVAGHRGQGRAAAVGLCALLILPWQGWMSLADFTVHSGYVFATASLVAVVGIRAGILIVTRRAGGRKIWPAVTGLLFLAFFLVVTVAGILDSNASVGMS